MSFDSNAFMQNPDYLKMFQLKLPSVYDTLAQLQQSNMAGSVFGMAPAAMGTSAVQGYGQMANAMQQLNQQGAGVQNLSGTPASPVSSNWFSNAMGDMTMGDLGNAALGMFGAYTGYQQMQEVGRRNDIAQGQLDLSRDQWDEKLRVNQAVANQNKGA